MANEMTVTPEVKEQVEKLKHDINLRDSSYVTYYGVEAQKEVSQFSDKILSEVRTKDAGESGGILTNLMLSMKEVNTENLSTKGQGISGIPIIGKLFNQAQKIIAQYEKVSVHVEKISRDLEKTKYQLMRDITTLDELYERNKTFYLNLEVYILAGEAKIEEIRTTVIPQLQVKAEQTGNPQDIQELDDTVRSVSRFEKKIHDLKLSQQICTQTAPSIRLIQDNSQDLADKIQTSILQTIPLWKTQLTIALTLYRQRNGLKVYKNVKNTTEELLLKNSEALKQGTIEIKKESEKGIIDIEVFRKTHSNLLQTLDETIRIQQDGKKKRKEVENELQTMDDELKAKLLEFARNSQTL